MRIFEARYLRLVSLASEQGFTLCYYSADSAYNIPTWGTWVNIVDFDALDDGMLTIDVEAKSLVSLSAPYCEDDGLNFATVEKLEHWRVEDSKVDSEPLANELRKIFAAEKVLEELYPSPNFKSLLWVCSRFLELLPLSIKQKRSFLEPDSFPEMLRLLNTLILGDVTDPTKDNSRIKL